MLNYIHNFGQEVTKWSFSFHIKDYFCVNVLLFIKKMFMYHNFFSCKYQYQLAIFINRFSRGSSYNLFKHNCNNFSEDIAQFLCGVSIPKYILQLPNEVLNTSLGAALPTLVAELEKSARPVAEEQERFVHREASPDFDQLNSQIEEARSDVRVNGVNKDKKE